MEKDIQNLNLKELRELYDIEEDPDKLNKIMAIISDKWVASDEEEKNYTSIEEDLYQQMGLIKLEDLEFVPLEDVKRKLENKMGKMIMDNNKIEEEINQENINENNFVNSVVQRPMFQGEPSQARAKYVPGRTTKFTCKFMPTQNLKS